jgi:hypothetical protein
VGEHAKDEVGELRPHIGADLRDLSERAGEDVMVVQAIFELLMSPTTSHSIS